MPTALDRQKHFSQIFKEEQEPQKGHDPDKCRDKLYRGPTAIRWNGEVGGMEGGSKLVLALRMGESARIVPNAEDQIQEGAMRSGMNFVRAIGVICLLVVSGAIGEAACAQGAATGFASRVAEVDGVKIHYTIGGHGAPLILLHGYAQTSRMWAPILPVLGEKFMIIAPDLPGIADSAIPADGLDMKTAANRIHALAQSLGFAKARVVGHDIGLMVAYAYATQFPAEVEKLVVMDAFLPGVEGWEAIYNSPNFWHFRFHGATPEELVRGRERIYFDYYWNEFAADRTHSLSEADRKAYTEAYSKPGRMKAGWGYFDSFPQAAKDFAEMSKTKLTMPVLSIGGEKSLGVALGQQMRLVGTDVTVVVLKDAGHWILDEKPKETTEALVKFL